MDPKEYKEYHEAHMKQNTGTSIQECLLLVSALPFAIFINSLVSTHISKVFHPVVEFILIILPVVLNSTLFSDRHLILLNYFLITSTIILKKVNVSNIKKVLNMNLESRKSFITNYRAGTNFYSALCILAVDFMIFPKRLAKTETFGFGFMDLGIGFFICSNGFVEKYSPSSNQLTKVLKSVLVLLVLGGARVLSVKSLDYHEHVSEYGVHWNFFFTLAMCRLISFCIIKATNYASPIWLGVFVGVLHQSLLWTSIQDWVLSAPRLDLVSANKEGIASCLGYICLYFTSSSLGKFMSYSKNLTYKKLLGVLVAVNCSTWIGLLIFVQFDQVSRMLVNLGYIFWILALSTAELLLYVGVEICIQSMQDKTKIELVPCLFESINANGLFFFLLSNLLTGLVNILFQTLLLGVMASMAIILNYMIILLTVTYVLYNKRIYLKI